MPDREQADAFFGHPGFEGSEHPHASPRPDQAVTRTRTSDTSPAPEKQFVVEVTYPDGNPLELAQFGDPQEAFEYATKEQAEEKRAGRAVVSVTDRAYPEFGRFHAHDYEGWLELVGTET